MAREGQMGISYRPFAAFTDYWAAGSGLPAFAFSLNSQASPFATLIFWGIMLLVGALVLWAICCLSSTRGRRTVRCWWLMPEGVVECYHDKVKGITSLAFERIEQIEVENGKVTANSPVY